MIVSDQSVSAKFRTPNLDWERREHAYKVAFIVDLFERAGCADEVGWCLSTSLSALDGAIFRKPNFQISRAQRAELLAALKHAYRAAIDYFGPEYGARPLNIGMHATAGLIDFWSQPDARRKARGGHVLDLRDRTRQLRNIAHNAALDEQIAERVERRNEARQQLFKDLIQVPPDGGPDAH